MADRAFAIKPVALSGAASAALLLFLTLGTILAVWSRAEAGAGLTSADWAAIRFTVVQALLSALFSCLLAIPLARALSRRKFPGRGVLIALLGAPFILPVIVAVLGLLAVFGRAGLLNSALSWAGLETVSIYGLHGVVLAHVFFNLPLATRLILHGWLAIPAERFRLAAGLGFVPREYFLRLEWPMLRAVLPGVFVVIFLICITSFAVALTLGGGPRATTVELAIYQAFRFDFDLGKAALLALVQFGLCAAAALASGLVTIPGAMGGGLDRVTQRWDGVRWIDYTVIAVVALFLLTPLLMVVMKGRGEITTLPAPVWQAAGRSLIVALCSAALALTLALPLGLWIVAMRRGAVLAEATGYLTVAASPLVIGTGLFILLFPFVSPQAMALPVTALVNAAMALPFVLRAVLPGLRESEETYGRLAESLHMRGWAKFRLLTLPRLRRPLGFATGLAAAMSMGDLGVVALFADEDTGTLPLMIYRLMGAYRTDQAEAAALLLLVLSFGLFWLFDRGGRVGS